MHGIPVLVKDNVATRDRTNTTAGSFALLGARVGDDSGVVARLRDGGAVVLGKTNMGSWDGTRTQAAPGSWSARGGLAVGAYFDGQDPLGASSGSAVAASLGLAWAALATETTSALLGPAHVANCVGIKPTVGLTSRHLVIPVSRRQDSVGPIARTVRDAAHLLAAIAGPDPRDNYTSAIPFSAPRDYVAACRPDGLRGRRIGVVRNIRDIERVEEPSTTPSLAAFDRSLEVLRAAGAEVVDNITLPSLVEYRKFPYQIVTLTADLRDHLGKHYLELLEENPANVTSLDDLRRFVKSSGLESSDEYDTYLWDLALEFAPEQGSADYWGNYTVAHDLVGTQGITGALERYSLDAIAMPPMYAGLTAGLLGLPAVTVPLGKTPDDSPRVASLSPGPLSASGPNQPFGIAFVGPAFAEESLISIAYAFEQRTQVRGTVRPHVQPKTELEAIVRKRLAGASGFP
ncbi:hypothetical protein CDD83_9679 [Cordyceps sp. RAO-2017]|nr:hypothetical protein CDD83_9679 [Cordyceps sp. RAO-2017]